MRAGIRISSFVPSGLVIESVSDSSDSIILAVGSEAGMAECPLCGARSRRIHSRYHRHVADLPSAGTLLRVVRRRSRLRTEPLIVAGIDDWCACRKSNTHIQMMESAKNWRRHNATNGLYCSRQRRVLVD